MYRNIGHSTTNRIKWSSPRCISVVSSSSLHGVVTTEERKKPNHTTGRSSHCRPVRLDGLLNSSSFDNKHFVVVVVVMSQQKQQQSQLHQQKQQQQQQQQRPTYNKKFHQNYNYIQSSLPASRYYSTSRSLYKEKHICDYGRFHCGTSTTTKISRCISIVTQLIMNHCGRMLCYDVVDTALTNRSSTNNIKQAHLKYYNQHYQSREFSSKREHKRRKGKNEEDPFEVLGIVRKKTSMVPKITTFGSSKEEEEDTIANAIKYVVVKQTFIKIAMQHHPDTSTATTPSEIDRHREIFMRARKAFEAIVEGPDGTAILRSESEKHKNNNDNNNNNEDYNFEAWFQSETGHAMPYMDMKTMKEVAEVTETMGGGLDRDGGMWTLAKMVTNSVKAGGDGTASVLQLEAGSVRDRSIDGILRRRKRR